MELEEYLEFRHKLAEWGKDYDVYWIEGFIEKLYLAYHTAYMQGRLDGIERMMCLQGEKNDRHDQDR